MYKNGARCSFPNNGHTATAPVSMPFTEQKVQRTAGLSLQRRQVQKQNRCCISRGHSDAGPTNSSNVAQASCVLLPGRLVSPATLLLLLAAPSSSVVVVGMMPFQQVSPPSPSAEPLYNAAQFERASEDALTVQPLCGLLTH